MLYPREDHYLLEIETEMGNDLIDNYKQYFENTNYKLTLKDKQIITRKLLKKYGFLQSMSGKGNCYDNAVAESFFHSLKTEHVYFEKYLTRAQARTSIFYYIEIL